MNIKKKATTVNIKKTAATAAMAGALGLGAVGLGTGIAQADPPGIPIPPIPPIPAPQIPGIPMPDIPWDGPNVNPAWVPGMPPGQNPFGPPGQVMKLPTLTLPDGTILNPNPFLNVPPGQWGNLNLNPALITWLPPGSDLMAPVNLVWDAASNAWGVFVDGVFTPYPIVFPPPPAG